MNTTSPDHHRDTSSPCLGVVMLDTQFPRFPGDVGNPDTWPCRVLYERVEGAGAEAVVHRTHEQDVQPFIEAALRLQRAGADTITTSCGFLSLWQTDIAAQLSVPFIASSLAQVPLVQSLLPPQQTVGILTIDALSLSRNHLRAADIHFAVPVMGMDADTHFSRSIIGNASSMDRQQCEQDVVEAAILFSRKTPQMGALVLECTNMAPYAPAIQQAIRLPVYSLVSLIAWIHAGLSPQAFADSRTARARS